MPGLSDLASIDCPEDAQVLAGPKLTQALTTSYAIAAIIFKVRSLVRIGVEAQRAPSQLV